MADDLALLIVGHVAPRRQAEALLELDLSLICAAPSAHLGHLAFEGQGAFTSQC